MNRTAMWTVRRALMALATFALLGSVNLADAAGTDELSKSAREALNRLYKVNQGAVVVGHTARAILVFPKIIRTGLVARPYAEFNGDYGEGALFSGGTATGYFNFVSKAHIPKSDDQSFSLVIFLMTPNAEGAIAQGGWELGMGPTVAIVDDGASRALAPTSINQDAYAFILGQRGLIAIVSLQGSKISPIGK